MVLQPKELKYRKSQKRVSVLKRKETRATKLAFGDFGLMALEAKFLNSNQLEAARKILQYHLKKEGKLFLRIFPQKPITQKPLGSSMGGGKGDVVGYVFPVKVGRIILEVGDAKEEDALKALKQAQYKLPIKTKIVKK